MRRTLRRIAFGILFGSLGVPSFALPASAQSQDAAAADALFRAGREAAEAGDHAGACARFHESNRLDSAVGTLFNIADCEEKLGNLATAWTAFEEVVQRLPPEDERHPIAAARAAALAPRLPRLRIHLEVGAPVGTSVSRDGVTLGGASLDTPLPVDPGRHVVEITSPGRPPRTYQVSLGEGETKTLDVAPSDATKAASGPPPVDPSRSGARTAGYAILGVGAAAAVAGVVTGILVLDRKRAVDENCDEDKRCDQAGVDAARSGKTFGVVTTVALAAGAVGLGAGTYLVLSAGRDPKSGTGFRSGIGLRGTF
ncbi:MAG: hypothetical protein JW751_18160 [Polyangiaceae bacterium]|nr:hypothetical protein [Polyangiaceae bacterium]